MRIILMVCAAAIATACSGSMTTTAQASESSAVSAALTQRSYQASGFTRISSVGPHRIVVSVGPAFSVSAEGPQKTLERTEVVVENGELKIQPARDERWEHEWRDYEPATFHVTLPRIEGATMVGSGQMMIDRASGDSFAGSVAGSGTLDVAGLSVSNANLSVAGSGDLVAHGSAHRSDVSIAGSGNLRARELSSASASISVAGSGDAELTVSNDAHVSIVGSGDVEVAGSARCTVSRIGSGDVTCANLDHETRISWR